MTQQDYTAPELPVKITRREAFRQVFEVLTADGAPDASLAAVPVWLDLLDASNIKVATVACVRPAEHGVLLEVPAALMRQLRAGRYRLEVYSLNGVTRQGLVTLLATVVDGNGAGGLGAVTLHRQLNEPVKLLLNRGTVNFFDSPASAAVVPIATSLKTYYQLRKQA